jgi:hypothetical protein
MANPSVTVSVYEQVVIRWLLVWIRPFPKQLAPTLNLAVRCRRGELGRFVLVDRGTINGGWHAAVTHDTYDISSTIEQMDFKACPVARIQKVVVNGDVSGEAERSQV